MSQNGKLKLAPDYVVIFCEGQDGYDQMYIMGKDWIFLDELLSNWALKKPIFLLKTVDEIITSICEVTIRFSRIAYDLLPEQIRSKTLQTIQSRIKHNIHLLNRT